MEKLISNLIYFRCLTIMTMIVLLPQYHVFTVPLGVLKR